MLKIWRFEKEILSLQRNFKKKKEKVMEDYKKKYEEAIERAKLYKGLQAEMSVVFPELAESEDERIRKALIEGFKVMKDGSYGECTFSNYNIPVTAIIAWLEKQKTTTFNKDIENIRNAAIYACKYMVDNFENSTKQYEDAIAWLEKQGEQKGPDSGGFWEGYNVAKRKFEQMPANKEETKFKVGDKVICLESFEGFVEGQIYSCKEEGWVGCDKQGDWTSHLDKFKLVDNQKPTEWSEEDEKLLNDAVSLAYECDDLELGDWLKSLKYRYNWND